LHRTTKFKRPFDLRKRFPGAAATGYYDVPIAEDPSYETLVHGNGFDLTE
jgi:hypothetical protein